MNYIQHCYSPKSVHRFIPIIRTVLTQHQRNGVASVKFNPLEMNLGVQTAIARLRDAVHSLSQGITTHADIDQETLKLVWRLYKVTSDGVNVMVISRETEQTEPELIQGGSSTCLSVLRTDDPRFAETLGAFAVLLGQRLLQGQVDIIGDLSKHLQHSLESANDVVFIQDGQEKYHMI